MFKVRINYFQVIQNLDFKIGFVNGTRVVILEFNKQTIQVHSLTGAFEGKPALIPTQ